MVPPFITRELIHSAAARIDREGVKKRRESRVFDVIVKGKPYPPKYLLSVASDIAGKPLSPDHFITTEARHFLTKHGFEIVEKQERPLSMPDEPVLTLEWLDDDSSGYTDYYPVSWFAKEGERKAEVHITRGPKGGVYRAQCDIRVAATTAEFDYAAYPEFNDAQEMFLGLQRLTFRDAKRTEILRAEWRGERGPFKESPIHTEQRSSARSELSATDDLPNDAPPGCAKPRQRSGTARFFVRDVKVRDAVLERAEGKCEFCSKPGFLTIAGFPYLETHHVTALAKDGPDTMDNVIALCANDHREAHFGSASDKLAVRMLEIVKLRQTEYLRKRRKRRSASS